MHDVKPCAGLVGKRRSSLRDGKKETELGPGNSFSCIRKDFNRETVGREGGQERGCCASQRASGQRALALQGRLRLIYKLLGLAGMSAGHFMSCCGLKQAQR